MPPRNRTIVPCDTCGAKLERTPWQTRTKAHHFCNRECQYRYYAPAQVPCATCGNMLSRPPTRLSKNNFHFCNLQCRDEWQRSQRHRKGMIVPCATCGNELYRTPEQLRRSTNHFCNRSCRAKWFSKNTSGENSWHWKGGVPTDSCVVCGKAVPKTRTHIGKHSTLCGKRCAHQWRHQRMAGENNLQWRGGYEEYYGPNWEQQRNKARKRDNFTCQVCGKTEQKLKRQLDVHHIKPFREFGYIPSENRAYEVANRLENLVCLCSTCHRGVEHGKIPFQPKLL